MKKEAFRQLLKSGPVIAYRMTEKDFDELLIDFLSTFGKLLPVF
jgi:hypothetical protein